MLQPTADHAKEPLATAREAFAQAMAGGYGIAADTITVPPWKGTPRNAYICHGKTGIFRVARDTGGVELQSGESNGGMGSKHLRLWAYNAVLVALTVALASRAWPWQADWPPWPVVLGFALFQLFVWQYGFLVPSMGMTSMERVPQVAALLLFPVEVAACVNALPALVFPFISRRYRQDSLAFGAIRAVHNACMIAVMCLVGGWAYAALGGRVPLLAPDWYDLLRVLVLALVLQVVNSGMILAFLKLDGRDVRRLATWNYLLSDTLFAPIGMLAALICENGNAVTSGLFLAFLLLTVVSMHKLVESRRQVQDRVAMLDAASGARLAVHGARRMDQLAERLVDHIGAVMPFRIAFVAALDTGRGEFDVLLELIEGRRTPRMRRSMGEGLTGQVVRSGEPLLIERWGQAPEALRAAAVLAPGERPGSILIVPIRQGGMVLGVVSVQHDQPGRYGDADRHVLQAIADDIAPAFADARTFQELDDYRLRLETLVTERTAALECVANEREALLAQLKCKSELLERQSREDALTGLANRRHFDERIVAEIAQASRHGTALSLALIDIDHFKRINDAGGHAQGDAVLATLAAALRTHFRGGDLVARIGGEEFAVLLPQTRLQDACDKLEAIRVQIAERELVPGWLVTISAGVAQWRLGEHRDALLRRVDGLLYAAKDDGRNRVMAGIDPEQTTLS
ncbi:MAG: GGDEF domain-containing protein [Dokdonella sp.]|nr:MAG: GGDEF domain-containing protein [Dokdonella sp.]